MLFIAGCQSVIMGFLLQQELDAVDTYPSSVINCLQDYKDEIENERCKSRVHHYLKLASDDIRFNIPLADACHEDREKLCAGVPSVSGSRCPSANTYIGVDFCVTYIPNLLLFPKFRASSAINKIARMLDPDCSGSVLSHTCNITHMQYSSARMPMLFARLTYKYANVAMLTSPAS